MEKIGFIMIFVFICWTLTSFACHFCAKLYLKESSLFGIDREFYVLVLSVLQVLSFMQVSSYSSATSEGLPLSKVVIFTAHACAVFLTNWSLAVTFATSTFGIKLMEPVTSVLLQNILLNVSLTNLQWISIPAVVLGAILFAQENNSCNLSVDKGSVIAFLSNICLSLRNIYIKQNHISNSCYTIQITRTRLGLIAFSAFGTIVILNTNIAPPGSAKLYIFLLSSCLFHAISIFISTNVVLKHYCNVGHAFGNISKRLIILGLFYVSGSKSMKIVNVIGLFVCATGLVIYASSKPLELTNNQINKVPTNSLQAMMKLKPFILSLIVMVVFVMFLHRDQRQMMSVDIQKYEERANKSVMTSSLSKELTFRIKEFLTLDLTRHPEDTNKLSRMLSKRSDVIAEAQRIHLNIFKTLFRGYKFAMLFDYSPSENKGDSSIAVGEILLLRKLEIEIVFSCNSFCKEHQLESAKEISKKYTSKDLIILFHGGGNVIGWPQSDHSRAQQIKRFMQFNIVMFPQSILQMEGDSHKKFCQDLYASHPNLTFVWRDKVSFNLGKKLFPKVRSLLSPDIAYQIGSIPRFMEPTFDIIWLKRTDKESPKYKTPPGPAGLRMHVSDWLMWKTPHADSPMENIFLMTTNGLMFLQRGRVVITDRLHGHILSTLLNIPHVYIDNNQRKISNYHNTWTAALDNVVLANSSTDALEKAVELLKELDKDLPAIKGYFT